MPRQYPLVNMPSPAPINAIGDLMQLASAAEMMKSRGREREQRARQETSQKVIADVYTKHKGHMPAAIGELEQGGYYAEANTLRAKQHEIQKTQQDELAARLKATREGFEISTRYLQGVEAADETERPKLWTAVRPRIVESLPGLAQYVPEQYDPTFVAHALPFGLTATEAAKRRQEAVEALNAKFTRGGDQLKRDKDVLEAMSTYLDVDGLTGEDVEQTLQSAEALYGASPAVRQRFGEIPQGPLAPEVQKGLLARLTDPKDDKTPASFDAAILAARAKGDAREVDRLLGLKARAAAAGREPDKPKKSNAPGGPSQAQKGAAERWKQGALSALEDRIRTGRDNDVPLSAAEITAEKTRIQASYLEQIGASPAKAAATAALPAPAAPKPPTFKTAKVAGGKVTVTAPTGQTYTFPNQQAADNFIRAATGGSR